MVDQLYLIVITVLLLAALGAAVPVLRGIIRDGRERQRQRDSDGTARHSDDEGLEAGVSTELDSDRAASETVVCPRCGEENDVGFRYCQRCTEQL